MSKDEPIRAVGRRDNLKAYNAAGQPKHKRGAKPGEGVGPWTKNGFEEEQRYTDPETGEVSHRWRTVPPDEVRCVGRIRLFSSPWRGNQCTRMAIKGGKVCRYHGGNLPNVRLAAQRNLAKAAMPATAALIHIALEKRDVSDSDRIKALLAVLDRVGVTGKTEVMIEIKPWQEMLKRIAGELPAASDGNILDGELVDEDDEVDD